MEFLTCSYARPAANIANVLANGTIPAAARPAATPIILPSAIPQSMKRSGCAFLNTPVFVAEARSASSTTRSLCSEPSSASALQQSAETSDLWAQKLALQDAQRRDKFRKKEMEYQALAEQLERQRDE